MKAWWFEPEDGKLGYGDGRKPAEGLTHKVKCEPVLCKSGLHASEHPSDALEYAQSNNLWLVELGGTIVKGSDKCAATERTYIKRVNVDSVLRKYARDVALINIEKAKPYFSEQGWDDCMAWLKDGDESKRYAANSASYAAARSASYAAARSAARSATYSAAHSATRSAARYATHSASYAAADAAAETKPRAMLLTAINDAFEEKGNE